MLCFIFSKYGLKLICNIYGIFTFLFLTVVIVNWMRLGYLILQYLLYNFEIKIYQNNNL